MNYDLELERAILGAIILEKDAIYQAMTIIKPGLFYDDNHNLIYDHIIKVTNLGKKIDLLTISNELRNAGKLEQIGGAYYLSKLTSTVGSSAHIEDHCRIVYDLYLKRKTRDILQAKIKELDEFTDNDIFDSYNGLNADLLNLFEMSLSNDYHNMIDVMTERLEEISKINNLDNNLIGIHTGFSKLNNFTNGFQPGDYIILGARPSMGKTIIALIIAIAAIFRSGKNVLFFSLEMSKKRIADRLLSIICDIDSKRIASNSLTNSEWDKITEMTSKYIDKHFIIIDSSNLSIEDIKARSIILNRKFGIDEIIIDYIQLIKYSFPRKDKVENVTHISKNIKSLAKELECPIIALSQLNRSGGIVPEMKELRDSGSLEQDADIIWLPYREDYENRECEPESRCRIDNLIAKNRNGDIGAFYTYRNEQWSYIGEIKYEELNSLEIPFGNEFN